MPSGPKPISKFQNGSPPQATDDFVFERAGVTYRVPFSALCIALSSLVVPGLDGLDGEDGLTIPGTAGATGPAGPSGKDGPLILLPYEPEESEFPITVPGPQGIPGIITSGKDGAPGAIWLPYEADDAEVPLLIPGPKGDIGAQGPQGIPGVSGSGSYLIILPGHENEPDFSDPSPVFGAPFNPYDKNVAYLGKVTGTGVTVGPLIWKEDFDRIYWEYQIGGYNGGTPVGRFLCGNGAPSTTALTNGNGLLENATANATSVSKPGIPLAVTLSSVARSGWGIIRGASGAFKQIDVTGQSGAVAVATSPTVFSARSYFSDLSTNLLIKQIQLSVYDTLITTAVSTNQFIATTYIRAWGIRSNS